jgi:hypothetical protein
LFVLLPLAAMAQGDVVVHGDPRLNMLLRKQHDEEVASVAPAPHKMPTPPKHHAVLAANTVPASLPGIATHSVSAVAATPPAGNNGPVVVYAAKAPEVKPLPSEYKGHPAGWTPYSQRKERVIYSGKGYRVQIYNGTDRKKAIEIKSEFMRTNPGVRTYLSFISPCFRVKVGNFRNRSDAMGMWREANSAFHPSMIVPDVVTISTF